MKSFAVNFALGLLRRRGKRGAFGGMTSCKNSRFLPGDPSRLWALLGRSKFNAADIPAATAPADDDDTVKALFPVYFDGGDQKIVAHKGYSMFEATIGVTGAFTESRINGSDDMGDTVGTVVPRGIPAAYRGETQETVWLYPCSRNGITNNKILVGRDSNGWIVAGHRNPTNVFTAADNGTGTFSSSTDVSYLFRIYDEDTDTESFHSAVVTHPAFTNIIQVRLTFTTAMALQMGERGTHVRIYRTLLDERPGIFYRVDPQMTDYVAGKGIPIGDIGASYDADDSATNTEAQINGTVRADGQEGTLSWAEHGGPPPAAGGATVFGSRVVLYDLPDRPQDIIYGPQGYGECFPVDFDGEYVYYLRMDSDKDDRVLRCTRAGQWLLVLCQNSIFKVGYLPTLEDPGFSRLVQDMLTDKTGIVGRFAADNFGIGQEQSLYTIYVSVEHGLMMTDGVNNGDILPATDFLGLVEKQYLSNVEVRDYPSRQEVWVFYTPKGGSTNTAALIVDYSEMDSMGLRVTGPVDAKAVTSCWAKDAIGEGRFYFTDATSLDVYLQDNGAVDAQLNTNGSGDIELTWNTARYFPFKQRGLVQVHRGLAYGVAGVARTFAVTHYSLDGKTEYAQEVDSFVLGAGETSDVFQPESTGIAFREQLYYLGPTGSVYDEASSNCAPALELIEYEYSKQGPVGWTG